MFNLTVLKNLIPAIFSAIILFFLYSLNSDNKQLKTDNSELRQDIKRVNGKNDNLAHTLANLTEQVGLLSGVVKEESERRAVAEEESQKLQDEIKDALKNNLCSVEFIPDSAVEQLRQHADRIRNSAVSSSANSRKFAN